MGQAKNRGTFEQRVAQAKARPTVERKPEPFVRQMTTEDLIRKFSRTLRTTPIASTCRAELHKRKSDGDAMAIQFLKDLTMLQAKTSARAQSNVNVWLTQWMVSQLKKKAFE